MQIATDPWTEPFWLAAKNETLVAPKCGQCGTFRMPPTPYCPKCQSQNTLWPSLSGKGTIYSFAICTKSPYADIADFLYIPIIVELEDAPGIRLVSNLIGATAEQAKIGA
ncbi:MAG TPA: zinc ribbon domain-containing protein, partial [Pseudomonadales bacterium]|nr:zinc ribbon domain-containing protein [Pseudomonadales bacterium]